MFALEMHSAGLAFCTAPAPLAMVARMRYDRVALGPAATRVRHAVCAKDTQTDLRNQRNAHTVVIYGRGIMFMFMCMCRHVRTAAQGMSARAMMCESGVARTTTSPGTPQACESRRVTGMRWTLGC